MDCWAASREEEMIEIPGTAMIPTALDASSPAIDLTWSYTEGHR
jgi:hypothetical protein